MNFSKLYSYFLNFNLAESKRKYHSKNLHQIYSRVGIWKKVLLPENKWKEFSKPHETIFENVNLCLSSL